jgi:hypothetical protein
MLFISAHVCAAMDEKPHHVAVTVAKLSSRANHLLAR